MVTISIFEVEGMGESYIVVSYRLIGLIQNNNYEAPLRIMFSYGHSQYVWVGVDEAVREGDNSLNSHVHVN